MQLLFMKTEVVIFSVSFPVRSRGMQS